jgi:hypothetical protein
LDGGSEDEELGDDVEGADCNPFGPLCSLQISYTIPCEQG